MIVYYTGTGNSRYVAQRFAADLGDDLITANEYIRNAGSRIAALCADIGLDYQGVLQVVMPENYVAMFYVPGAEESAQIIAAAQPSIDGGIACVQCGEAFPAPKVGLLDRFKTGPVNTIFYRGLSSPGRSRSRMRASAAASAH